MLICSVFSFGLRYFIFNGVSFSMRLRLELCVSFNAGSTKSEMGSNNLLFTVRVDHGNIWSKVEVGSTSVWSGTKERVDMLVKYAGHSIEGKQGRIDFMAISLALAR